MIAGADNAEAFIKHAKAKGLVQQSIERYRLIEPKVAPLASDIATAVSAY